MNKAFIPWIGVILIAVFGAFIIFQDNVSVSSVNGGSNVFMKNGIQYVTLIAEGGYTPRTSTIA